MILWSFKDGKKLNDFLKIFKNEKNENFRSKFAIFKDGFHNKIIIGLHITKIILIERDKNGT